MAVVCAFDADRRLDEIVAEIAKNNKNCKYKLSFRV